MNSESSGMPTIITLRVELLAETPLAAASAPANGWFMTLLKGADQTWGTALHIPNQKRPYAIAPLYHEGTGRVPLWERSLLGRQHLRRGQVWVVRIALLDDSRAAWLCGILPELALPTLGRAPVRLLRFPTFTSDDPDLWHCSWSSLADAPPSAGMMLHFETPTAFVSQDEVLPRAEPERFWASWLRAWESFAPEPLAGVALLAESLPLIRRYELATRDAAIKDGLFIGFTGWMELAWREGAPQEARRAACALAQLAAFCGTGAKTALGMGQTRIEIF